MERPVQKFEDESNKVRVITRESSWDDLYASSSRSEHVSRQDQAPPESFHHHKIQTVNQT